MSMAVLEPCGGALGRSNPIVQLWAFEIKWDGQRAIAVARDGECRLYSRNGNDITNSLPELPEALLGALRGRNGIVDGEVVALDEKGRPAATSDARATADSAAPGRGPDVVRRVRSPGGRRQLDHRTSLSRSRRTALDDLVQPGPVQVPPHWTDVDGQQMLDLAREHGLEGVVAKRVGSTYRPGRRAPTWIKTPLRNNSEAIVIGWSTAPGPPVTVSAHCCSARTTTTAAWSTSATSEPDSPPLTEGWCSRVESDSLVDRTGTDGWVEVDADLNAAVELSCPTCQSANRPEKHAPGLASSRTKGPRATTRQAFSPAAPSRNEGFSTSIFPDDRGCSAGLHMQP